MLGCPSPLFFSTTKLQLNIQQLWVQVSVLSVQEAVDCVGKYVNQECGFYSRVISDLDDDEGICCLSGESLSAGFIRGHNGVE